MAKVKLLVAQSSIPLISSGPRTMFWIDEWMCEEWRILLTGSFVGDSFFSLASWHTNSLTSNASFLLVPIIRHSYPLLQLQSIYMYFEPFLINNLEFKILYISTSQHFNLNVVSQVQQVLNNQWPLIPKLVLFLIFYVLTKVTTNTNRQVKIIFITPDRAFSPIPLFLILNLSYHHCHYPALSRFVVILIFNSYPTPQKLYIQYRNTLKCFSLASKQETSCIFNSSDSGLNSIMLF